MRSSVSEPLIPLNAANLRIIFHAFSAKALQINSLSDTQLQSLSHKNVKAPLAVPDAYDDEQVNR